MRVLVYGGGGSGKSAFAERFMLELGEAGRRWYVATMRPDGHEAAERIARHQAVRSHKGFTTVERYTDLGGLELADASPALLECVGNLLANEMFSPGGTAGDPLETVWRGIEALAGRCGHMLAVSNDVSADGATYHPETEAYRRNLAEINRRLAAMCEVVVETVCGIPVFHKSVPEVKACGR